MQNVNPINEQHESEQSGDQLTAMMWGASLVPDRHARNVEVRANPGDPTWADAYGLITERLGCGFTYGLYGEFGSGKTQLGTCVIRRACELGCQCLYIRANMIIRPGNMGSHLRQRIFTDSLLVVDDIGPLSECERGILTNLVDRRYANMHDTVLIAATIEPETPANLDHAFGYAVRSRIAETGLAFYLDYKHRPE